MACSPVDKKSVKSSKGGASSSKIRVTFLAATALPRSISMNQSSGESFGAKLQPVAGSPSMTNAACREFEPTLWMPPPKSAALSAALIPLWMRTGRIVPSCVSSTAPSGSSHRPHSDAVSKRICSPYAPSAMHPHSARERRTGKRIRWSIANLPALESAPHYWPYYAFFVPTSTRIKA